MGLSLFDENDVTVLLMSGMQVQALSHINTFTALVNYLPS